MPRRAPEWSDAMNGQMTLEQALKTWNRALVAAGRSESLRSAYERVGGRYLRYLEEEGATKPRVSQLTPERVRGFLLWLKVQPPAVVHGQVRTLGPRSFNYHVIALKAFGHFLLEHGVYKTDPLAGLKNPKVPKIEVTPFTRDEVRLLVATIGEKPLATRNRALVYFMLASGCRAAEVCGLKVSDVDLKGHTAKVLGKGSKERTVQFDRATARYLALWLSERPEVPAGDGCVFVGSTGEALTTGGLYRIIRRLGDAAGVKHPHPHRLRHSFAVYWLEANPGQVFQLQNLLGHEHLEMSRRYTHTAEARRIPTGPSVIDTLGLH